MEIGSLELRIEQLLTEAEAAAARQDWETVSARANKVLALDGNNADARALALAGAQLALRRQRMVVPAPSGALGPHRPPPGWLANGRVRALRVLGRRLGIANVSGAVAEERPDISDTAGSDGTVTLLFSDIEGSVALNERLGDEKWLALLHAHNSVIADEVRSRSGRVVKTMGDGCMAAFANPPAGVASAVAIQQRLPARLPREEAPVRVRIGLHVGYVTQQDGDFFGREVNYAARVASAAAGGQVLASERVVERTPPPGDWRFDAGREIELKGFQGVHRVHEVVW